MTKTWTKTWFVTGATRGIGAAIVRAALDSGDRVVATGRDPHKMEQIFGPGAEQLLVLQLDVTRNEQIEAAVRAAVERFGRIDVLVNNAGFGQLGVFEETTPQQVRAQYETNVFGVMAVTRAVLPVMRSQRGGRILNIGSIAGRRGVFGGSIYNSSKFAVEGFSQSIAEELAPLGIYVTAVSPGVFRTGFLDAGSVKYAEDEIGDYAQARTRFRAFHENRNNKRSGDPDKLAAVVVHLAEVDDPPVSFVVGSDAFMGAINAIKIQKDQIEAWKNLSISSDVRSSKTTAA